MPGMFSYNLTTAFGSDANNITGNSANLANSFVYGGGTAVLTLEGLEPGVDYRATIFIVGFEPYGRAATIVAPGGEMLTVDASGLGNNNGQRVDIEFTASGTTEEIKLNAIYATNSFHTYAFAVAREKDSSGTIILLQ